MELIIRPGRAIISDGGVAVHHYTEDFLAVEIDLRSDFVRPVVVRSDAATSSPAAVVLMTDENTTSVDESYDLSEQTKVTLPPSTRDWSVLVGADRHTIQIVAWRRQDFDAQ